SLLHRIARFFIVHCLHPAGKKLVHIKMEKLANEMNDSRLNVSRALNHMQSQGLIELKRGRIAIPMLEKLVTEWG
ncbi:MAG: winged helix-turn-helix domain-containing protein, partial [Prevotella shahii]